MMSDIEYAKVSLPADWDAVDDTELDKEDARLSQMMVEYYQKFLPSGFGGCGYFNRQLLQTFHLGPDIPRELSYFSTPRSLNSIPKYHDTPKDHPLRAIAWVLDEADQSSTVRVFCYRLTDPLALELLVHAGKDREIQVILSPDPANENGLNNFVDAFGPIGRNALLENMEIRLAILSGSRCESSRVSMQQRSVITERYAAVGSYNLSTFARVGNWEEVSIVPATRTHKDRFDSMWNELCTRPMEQYYTRFQGVPLGPRRQRRQDLRCRMAAQAQERLRDRQRQAAAPYGR